MSNWHYLLILINIANNKRLSYFKHKQERQMSILDTIKQPSDIKKLNTKELIHLAEELREYLIKTVSITGGHLASNLGVVELTLALYKVFDFEKDKLIWDVGHQSYVHKIITGRKEALKTIRTKNGISGFPNREESKYDVFNTGHSSTSISAALGFARARDIKGGDENIVAVIGDGAMTGGMAFEALNDWGVSKNKMIVILNDNNMSISNNIGGLSNHLSKIRISKRYAALKLKTLKIIKGIPLAGDRAVTLLNKMRDNLKFALINGKMFEQFGLKYIGPIDGHNIEEIIEFLSYVKDMDAPIVLHIITQKGKGLKGAEVNPTKYHGIEAFNGKQCCHSNSKAMSETLCEIARTNEKVIGITAAMAEGTKLDIFQKEFPNRFFDVAICEPHAVTFAAALAASGMKPYFAVYSTFLQRAFDQILHDVCLMNLGVVFCIDRAGIAGADGVTHQGIYDLSYLSLMPNMTIVAPKNIAELKEFMYWSNSFNTPLAIRYSKDSILEDLNLPCDSIELGKWEYIKNSNTNIYIIASGGRMLKLAILTADILAKDNISVNIINARFIKPLDYNLLDNIQDSSIVLTLEDNVARGGLGEAIAAHFIKTSKDIRIKNIAMPELVKELGTIDEVFETLGFTPDMIAKTVKELVNN